MALEDSENIYELLSIVRPDTAPPRSEVDAPALPISLFLHPGLEDKTITYKEFINFSPANEDPNEKFKFGCSDIAWRIGLLLLYVFDVGTDIWAAYMHFQNGNWIFFWLTIAFLVVPGFATSAISLKYYLTDEKMRESDDKIHRCWRWTIISFCLITMMSPALKDIQGLRYGCKMRRAEDLKEKRKWLIKMNEEDRDRTLLKLFLALLEDAPQLIIQFSVLASPMPESTIYSNAKLVVPMVFSLLGLGVTQAFYHRSLRRLTGNVMDQLSLAVTAFIALWCVLFLLARVLALGLLGILCPIWLTCVLCQRWVVMTIWILSMKSSYCTNKFQDFFFHCLMGAVYIFCYLNTKNTPTKWRMLYFYLYTFMENSTIMILWFVFVDPAAWYRLPAILTQFLSFFAAVILMGIYYLFLHPKAKMGIITKTEEVVPD